MVSLRQPVNMTISLYIVCIVTIINIFNAKVKANVI